VSGTVGIPVIHGREDVKGSLGPFAVACQPGLIVVDQTPAARRIAATQSCADLVAVSSTRWALSQA